MEGKTDLNELLANMNPVLNNGSFVFVSVSNETKIDHSQIVGSFKEEEGITLITKKEVADKLKLPYNLITSWITLKVHSSLAAIGLTAAFSNALSQEGISCNVVSGYYHDHIFVPKSDAEWAIKTLKNISKKNKG